MEQERRMNGLGQLGKLASGHFAKMSLSNGTLTAVALEEKRGGVIHSCDNHNCKIQLLNERARNHDPIDMTLERANSSSNIQTKLNIGKQLQRNGDIMVPPSHRVLLSEKPGYATLQRTRYSITSLGRHRHVPESESCF